MSFEIRMDDGSALPVRRAYLHMERKMLQKFSLVGSVSQCENAAPVDLDGLVYAVVHPALRATPYHKMFRKEWDVKPDFGQWVVCGTDSFTFNATNTDGRLAFTADRLARPTWTSWFLVGIYVHDREAFHVHYNRLDLMGYRKKWGTASEMGLSATPVQSVGSYMLHKTQARLSTQTKAFELSRNLRYDSGRFRYHEFDLEQCIGMERNRPDEPVEGLLGLNAMMEVL